MLGVVLVDIALTAVGEKKNSGFTRSLPIAQLANYNWQLVNSDSVERSVMSMFIGRHVDCTTIQYFL